MLSSTGYEAVGYFRSRYQPENETHPDIQLLLVTSLYGSALSKERLKTVRSKLNMNNKVILDHGVSDLAGYVVCIGQDVRLGGPHTSLRRVYHNPAPQQNPLYTANFWTVFNSSENDSSLYILKYAYIERCHKRLLCASKEEHCNFLCLVFH